jgi:serine/threonine protein kinase/Tfp pilus assembly protein PilF
MSQLNDAPGGSTGSDGDSLDRLASRFEAAWEQGPPPALDDFVPPGDRRALTEVAHIDLERRLKAGEGVRVENYLERYPALAEGPEAVLALIKTEYEQRRRREPALSVAEYRQRFPQHSAALEQRLGESTSPPGPALAEGSTMPSAADGSGGPALNPAAAGASGMRYRALHFHAKGGLGEVWVAHDEEFQRPVALKRIREEYADDAESRRRFLREAEVTGRLEHPGIVPAYGLTRDAQGRPYYAMRLIRGGTLKDAIQRFHQADQAGRDPGERSLALRQLLGRFIAVCQAVAYAHSRGIVHRDLKPSNVMLGEKYGETLLVDWGLAKVVGRSESDRVSAEEGTLRPRSGGGEDTRTGQAVGTLAYMSPEQAAGRWDVVGPASDSYSLGATLYHLLTGRAPFGAGLSGEIVLQVQRGEFPRPRQVNPAVHRALEAVCLKAMALRPADRYSTALELAADVEHWLADGPVAALDDWAYGAKSASRCAWLLAVARQADPDRWRNHFRDPKVWQDRQALQRLARLLRDRGADALSLLAAAQARRPQDFWLNFELGNALYGRKQAGEAVGYYRAALALRPNTSAVYNNLGNALHDQGHLYRAIACYHKALTIAPKNAKAYANLGAALYTKGEVDGAIACYHKALTIAPKYALAHGALGQALLQQGRLTEARDSTRRCLQLLPQRDPMRLIASQQLRQCERLLVLDARLPALLQGQAQPASATEHLEYADLCQRKRWYGAAAHFAAAAFAADPKLADNPATGQRYNAACWAARAVVGQGQDKHLAAGERARCRQQAVTWLRDDLARWTQILDTGNPQARAAVQQQLRHWQRDRDLAGNRDAAWLVNLPADELRACRQLWADVDALLKRAGLPGAGKPMPARRGQSPATMLTISPRGVHHEDGRATTTGRPGRFEAGAGSAGGWTRRARRVSPAPRPGRAR